MASPFNEVFTIIQMDDNGQPVEIIPYNTDAATYVAVSITICREMLKDSRVQNVFKKFADKFDPNNESGAWSKNLPKKNVHELFINQILERFPPVFVADAMKNPDMGACTYRHKWGDQGFDTQNQSISINGPRVRKMCAAGTNPDGFNDPNSYWQQQFRTFLFIVAKSMLHELGHIFVTFLGLGETNSPPDMNIEVEGIPPTVAEAGRYLEGLIFGGAFFLFRDPGVGEGQAGIFFLEDREDCRQVKQTTIDEFVNFREYCSGWSSGTPCIAKRRCLSEFSFPITDLGASATGYERSLGLGITREYPFHDPLYWVEVRELMSLHEANPSKFSIILHDLMAKNPNPKTYTKQNAALMMRVPFEPGLRPRIEEAQA